MLDVRGDGSITSGTSGTTTAAPTTTTSSSTRVKCLLEYQAPAPISQISHALQYSSSSNSSQLSASSHQNKSHPTSGLACLGFSDRIELVGLPLLSSSTTSSSTTTASTTSTTVAGYQPTSDFWTGRGTCSTHGRHQLRLGGPLSRLGGQYTSTTDITSVGSQFPLDLHCSRGERKTRKESGGSHAFDSEIKLRQILSIMIYHIFRIFTRKQHMHINSGMINMKY